MLNYTTKVGESYVVLLGSFMLPGFYLFTPNQTFEIRSSALVPWQLISNIHTGTVVFWVSNGSAEVISMIARFAIDVLEYSKHRWLGRWYLAVVSALFHEAE